ncbi:MAG: hypothetical protein QXE01_12035 [Sulfolobales archaeon]
MKLVGGVAEYLGVVRGSEEDAYKILLDSLGYILWSLGMSSTDAPRILEGLGLDLPRDFVEKISLDVESYIGRSSPEDLYRYQEEVLEMVSKKYMLTPFRASRSSIEAASSLASELVGKRWGISIADPFMGSGELLRRAVEAMGVERISRVFGLEENPLACVVAYASLIAIAGVDRVYVRCDNAFKHLYRVVSTGSQILLYDVIVTTTPSHDIENLPREYADIMLESLVSLGYVDAASRIFIDAPAASILIANSILKEQGILSAIARGTLLHRLTGFIARSLFRTRYSVLSIIKSSVDSRKRGSQGIEVVITAIKSPGSSETLFIDADDGIELRTLLNIARGGAIQAGLEARVNRANLRAISSLMNRNWLLLFTRGNMDRRLVEVISRLASSGRIVSLRRIIFEIDIRRGVDIVSPDFFMLPNRYWIIKDEYGDYIVIKNIEDGRELEINRRYVKPFISFSDYRKERIMFLHARHYILSIPEEGIDRLQKDLVRYIEWGMRSGAAASAIRKFGSSWYSYLYRRITSMRPYGVVFIPAMVDISILRNSFYAVSSSKYDVIADGDLYTLGRATNYHNLLAVWFNSTPFLSIIAMLCKTSKGSWIFYDKQDYLELPAPNVGRIENRELIGESTLLLNDVVKEVLPPLEEQILGRHWVRERIDGLVSAYIGLRGEEMEIMRESLLESISELARRA